MIFGFDFCGLIPQSDFDTKCDNSVVAPVESGATASRAYAIGEHFIRDGAFCTAKTAIASGAAFTLNTNYTAGNIGDVFKNNVPYSYKTLGSETNSFDDILKYGNGIFSIKLSSSSQAPDNSELFWYVIQESFYSNNEVAVQIATNSARLSENVYLRKLQNGTWSSWKQIYSNVIYVNGYYPIVGQNSGKLVISIPYTGNYTQCSLSKTTNINVDIYGNITGNRFVATYDSYGMNDGCIFLNFTVDNAISTVLGNTKPGIAHFITSFKLTLS